MRIKTVGDFRRAVRMGPYAWPGGYSIFGVTSDGGVLCARCMDAERRSIAYAIGHDVPDGWRVEAVDCMANVDGDDTMICDGCNVNMHAERDDYAVTFRTLADEIGTAQ
jgi:hypothetical protein